MLKRIVVRYSTTCKHCKQSVEVGTIAYWRKGHGTFHTQCRDSETATDAQNSPVDTPKPKTVAKSEDGVTVATIDWGELKSRFLTLIDSKSAAKAGVRGRGNQSTLNYLRRQWESAQSESWWGSTLPNLKAWIDRGYRVEGLRNIDTSIIPSKERRKLRFSDEGELQIDLALSGFDYPFQKWDKRESRPGMSVEVDVNFNAGFGSNTVSAYTTWIAQAMAAIETAGIDLDVNIKLVTRGEFTSRRNETLKTLVRVKKENEASDFVRWSALVSPGGFRMLGFAAEIFAGDNIGWYDANNGLGTAVTGNSWDVRWNEERRTMQIDCSRFTGEFPREEMTQKLREIMKKAVH